jgi:hypothetical protein
MYYTTNPDRITHTIEIFRGDKRDVEGEEFGTFFDTVFNGVQATTAIYAWLKVQGVVDTDPDVYALVVPDGEGLSNQPLAVLPIGPVTHSLGGRPSIAKDGRTTRVAVTFPDDLLRLVDRHAEVTGTNRSDLIRHITRDGLIQAIDLQICNELEQAAQWDAESRGDEHLGSWQLTESGMENAIDTMMSIYPTLDRETLATRMRWIHSGRTTPATTNLIA